MARRIVDYNRNIKILNTEQLPKGLGCKLLLCETPHYTEPEEYIANRWLRKMPENTRPGQVVVRF
jgi:hypothetical protein